MRVNSVTLNENQQDTSIGCVGSTIRWIAQSIMKLVQPIFTRIGWHNTTASLSDTKPVIDVTFEVALLDGLRKGFVAPQAVLRHFEKYVNSEGKDRVYDHLGRKRGITCLDRVLNALWRDVQTVLARYREIGKLEAKIDPYRVATYLEIALQKKIDRS